MSRLLVLGAAAALLSACASTAPANDQLASNDDGQKVVCKSIQVTGSNRPQRICLPKAEWTSTEEEQRETTQERVDRVDRRTSNSTGLLDPVAGGGFGN
ncbi:MAG: hypothetical protein R3C52_14065 [Hyphomonadaceae bacterium]